MLTGGRAAYPLSLRLETLDPKPPETLNSTLILTVPKPFVLESPGTKALNPFTPQPATLVLKEPVRSPYPLNGKPQTVNP